MYDGTWGNGAPLPQEIIDFELMHYMRWSWRQLDEETPPYVRKYCTDLMLVKLRVAAEQAERGRH